MKYTLLTSAIALSTAFSGPVFADTGLSFSGAVQLSANGGANKTKLVRMSSGRLVSVFGDFTDPQGYTVYDVKAQEERPARDIFMRYCDGDCSESGNWSAAVNLSNTATKSSMDADWNGDGTRTEFWGDSDKPNIYNTGSRIVVTWVDKYCPGGDQRSVSYLTLENREIPFSCTYAITSADNGATWSDPVQLSSGERDAKQDVSRGLGTGQWAITWQEDPRGLQLGEADGPGDGASGANVSHGTDIWYSYAVSGWTDQDLGIWSTPVRVTDNYDTQTASGSFDTIRDTNGNEVDDDSIESGKAGAARANLALQMGSLDNSTPQVILAYEETKGSEGLDEGKLIRYHTFDWNNPQEEAGCVISNPTLNARRVRFVPQKEAGPNSGLRLGIFWKEGEYTQGGPSDIMLRLGIVDGGNGFSPEELVPAVDSNCAVSDFDQFIQLNNSPALNMSSRTETAEATTDADLANSTLSDDTYVKVEENALAHRGLLRGDDLYIGYSYTPVLAELLYTNTQNYNFYLRHYDAAAGTWSAPENMSGITDTGVNAREPRLVGTPGTNATKCETDAEECQDTSRFYVAWGSQTNISEWSQDETTELDLYITRAEDKGTYMTPVVRFAGEEDGVETFESQIRMTPAGNHLFAVWNQIDSEGTHAIFRQAEAIELPEDTEEEKASSDNDGDGQLIGCSYHPGAPFDPTLFLLTALAIGGLTVRRMKAGS